MSAFLSPCGRYRYQLSRDFFPGPVDGGRTLFVMLNPSTADGTIDDPTIRRCRGFAQRLGSCAFDVVNLYAWRATDPNDLRRATDYADIIGPENDMHIGCAADKATIIVAAWGALNLGGMSKPAASRARDVMMRLNVAAAGHDVLCLGTAKNGQPRHPLMVSYAVTPVPFKEPPHAR